MSSFLYLPEHYQPQPRSVIPNHVRPFYSYQDCTGQTATLPALIDMLRPISREDAIRVLCAISRALLRLDGMKAEAHLSAARAFLQADWSQRLFDLMKRDGKNAGSVFNRRSLWLIFQLASITCKEAVSGVSNAEISQRLLHACFMANDLVSALDNSAEQITAEDFNETIIGAVTPLIGREFTRVDFDLIGRARLLWKSSAEAREFQKKIGELNVPPPDRAFESTYGIGIFDFMRFMVMLYCRFAANQLSDTDGPYLFVPDEDHAAKAFGEQFCQTALKLISQGPDVLNISLMSPRQSWINDTTPLRERPLIEISSRKYCCPDLTIFVQSVVERIFFLLEAAYKKGPFRQLFGALFESYSRILIEEFAPPSVLGRTYFHSPTFADRPKEQVGDGILFWSETVAIMEYKASILTTRQKHAGVSETVIDAIDSALASRGERNRKGTTQLARNIARILNGESRIRSDGTEINLAKCERIIPILVCYEESFGFFAVNHYLQNRLDEALEAENVARELVQPLIVLTVDDLELLSIAGKSLSVERLLIQYCGHLKDSRRNPLGTFGHFLAQYKFDYQESVTFLAHKEALEEVRRFIDAYDKNEE